LFFLAVAIELLEKIVFQRHGESNDVGHGFSFGLLYLKTGVSLRLFGSAS
jgi:hypothetical protein